MPDVSTEEELTQKEEERAERKLQVQLRLEYQMQKLRIEQERRARETDEKLRQLEEQKTLEMLKLEVNTDEEDELQPKNLEKPIEPHGGTSWSISAAVTMKTIWAKTGNLFKHRVTINKKQTTLQPHLSGNTVRAGWGH